MRVRIWSRCCYATFCNVRLWHWFGLRVAFLIRSDPRTFYHEAIGSIMNAPWQVHKAVTFGQACVAQGVIKHMADVGTATWCVSHD